MDKAPDAYRTISEVGEDLDIAQHVLRFWETRFPQIKPLKRGGGRRYYRPDDVELLKGIRHLLYREGYTIKGVQRILKEQGARAVQAVGRGDGLVPGLAPASPNDAFEDDAFEDDAFENDAFEDVAPPPAAHAPPEPPRRTQAPPPPEILTPVPASSQQLVLALQPAPQAVEPPSTASRMKEGQVSFTRGGLGARPSSMPPNEPSLAGQAASISPQPAHPFARKAFLDALNELESARAAIGRILASRHRPGAD